MKLDQKINIVIDLIGYPLDIDFINEILKIDTLLYPGLVNQIYVLGVDIKDYVFNPSVLKALGTKEMKKKVRCLTIENYEETLYKDIRECTAMEYYKGILTKEIFDLRPMIIDSLIDASLQTK